MGRALARSNTVGRVATTCMLTALVAIMTACGSPEPVTATSVTIESPSVGVNPDTKLPECKRSDAITLGESTSPSSMIKVTSSWGGNTLTIKALREFQLVGVIIGQVDGSKALYGFLNPDNGQSDFNMKTGDEYIAEARRFAVSPDITATITRINNATLCVK